MKRPQKVRLKNLTFKVTTLLFCDFLLGGKKLDLISYQKWVCDFYRSRGWNEFSPFIRVNFLMEEVGEVSRAVRTIEIGRDRPDEVDLPKIEQMENLMEELGDVLDNILILADHYQLNVQEIMEKHQRKLSKRYEKGQ